MFSDDAKELGGLCGAEDLPWASHMQSIAQACWIKNLLATAPTKILATINSPLIFKPHIPACPIRHAISSQRSRCFDRLEFSLSLERDLTEWRIFIMRKRPWQKINTKDARNPSADMPREQNPGSKTSHLLSPKVGVEKCARKSEIQVLLSKVTTHSVHILSCTVLEALGSKEYIQMSQSLSYLILLSCHSHSHKVRILEDQIQICRHACLF